MTFYFLLSTFVHKYLHFLSLNNFQVTFVFQRDQFLLQVADLLLSLKLLLLEVE